MHYTVAELAELVRGQLTGDPKKTITCVLPNDCATSEAIAFLSGDKSLADAEKCKAGALLVRRGFGPARVPTIEVADPRAAALQIAAMFHPPVPRPRPGVHPQAAIDPGATIGRDCYVGPFAVIEAGASIGDACVIHSHAVVRANCSVGEGVEIHPHAVLYPHTVVGDRAVIHAGVVLGCDGFGYSITGDGHAKVPQLGHVEIGADVEIGANTTIDRGTIGATTIGRGTKIDNLVMVGHNCRIGRHNVLAAQAGLAGSCKSGDFVFMGGKAGVADHIEIGEGAVLLAYAAVHKDVPAGERIGGYPARNMRDFAVESAALARLPQMMKDFARIRRRLENEGEDRKCA